MLVVGASVLQDNDSLVTLQPGVSEFIVILVKSLNEVYRRLETANLCLQEEALRMLAQVAPKGDEQAIAKVLECLEHDKPDRMKRAAAKTLPHLVTRGDTRAVSVLTRCTTYTDTPTRLASLEALTEIAERGDTKTIDAARACLKDFALVRSAARDLLQVLL